MFISVKRLTSIDLNNCYNLTDEAFKCLETPLSHLGENLRSINVSNVNKLTSLATTRIALACKKLSHFYLAGVSKVGDDGIVQIAESGLLEELDLSAKMLGMPSTTSSTPRVGPRALLAVGQHCENLRVLRLNECSRVNDISIMTLARGCTRLEEICLRRCYKLGDKALSALGKYCHGIRVINISSCKNMTDVGLDKLSNGCRDLIEINLSNLLVTDTGITCLSRCQYLRTLILQNCYRLSDASLSIILKNCCLLEKVDLKGVDLVTNLPFEVSYLPNLTTGAFGGEISEDMISKIADNSLFCEEMNGKLVPVYRTTEKQRQHRRVSPHIGTQI